MTAPEPETDDQYIARVARETGESEADVRDIVNALKSMNEEDELVRLHEGDEEDLDRPEKGRGGEEIGYW
jgi:hypothetical protein